ncbi:MAG: methylenetetrahydrofolate reductase C-terminal domain-containing protein [Actinomycetota bacterium]
MWFDCRSCGQCILSTTGFVCPMRCPKKLRNGICGGSSKGTCEVDRTKRCVWEEIYEGSKSLDRIRLLDKFQKPVDSRLHNTSSFVNMFDRRIEGMNIIAEGKGSKVCQLMKVLSHLVKIRWRKFLHPSRYHQKYPNHYLGV